MDNETAARIYAAPAREALAAFPIEAASMRLLSVSENVSFRVDAADGAVFVLRLHRPGYHSLAELNSERAWTRALRAAGIAAQAGVRASSGKEYVRVRIEAAGERRYAGVLRWVEGEILADVLAREPAAGGARLAAFRRLGALMAAMHDQASAWRAAATFRRRHLDADGLMGEAPVWGRFWDHEALTAGERSLLLATRARLHAELRGHGQASGAYGLIHADLHPANVLVAGDELSVIDFDDSAYGWALYDIAAALIASRGHDDFADLTEALLAGYQTRRPLSAADRSLLPMFLLVRGLAFIGWLHQRPEHNSERHRRFFEDTRAWVCDRAAQL